MWPGARHVKEPWVCGREIPFHLWQCVWGGVITLNVGAPLAHGSCSFLPLAQGCFGFPCETFLCVALRTIPQGRSCLMKFSMPCPAAWAGCSGPSECLDLASTSSLRSTSPSRPTPRSLACSPTRYCILAPRWHPQISTPRALSPRLFLNLIPGHHRESSSF